MLTILNDTHIGVQRVAGTTPRSAIALSAHVLESFRDLIFNTDTDLCVLGDLFDQYLVPNSDLLYTYTVLYSWLDKRSHKLYLVAGNHDLSKDSSRLSSYELLCKLLASAFPGRVFQVMEPMSIVHRVWAIPHLVNQDRFDQALSEVPEHTKFLLLHANYNNIHAEQADHSLNVTEQQALRLTERGIKLVFAHEHQRRTALDGMVQVIGNQIPTSVADCLGAGRKFLAAIDGDELRLEEVLKVEDVFEVREWRTLGTPPLNGGDTPFLRVNGDATANEAADVVATIAKYRAKSDALVITNAVKIEGVEALDKLPETLESAKAFDVLGAILETLEPVEQQVVKKLLEEAQ